jgi:hypothetical protein
MIPSMTVEIVAGKSADKRPAAGGCRPCDAPEVAPRKGRSRISNGRDLLPDVDGRSVIARRYRDIASAILIDQGGADRCSESRTQLIRRFAAAAVLAEQLESKLANGAEIDVQEHALLCSTLTRLAQRIGIDRVARNITTFGDLMRADIEERRAEAVAAASADEVTS